MYGKKSAFLQIIFSIFVFLASYQFVYAVNFNNVRGENFYFPGMQIKWSTDIAGDSMVLYGFSSGSYPNSQPGDCYATSTPYYLTDHCVNFTNLTANTTYYYKVQTAGAQSLEYKFCSGSSSSTGYNGECSGSTTGSSTTISSGTPTSPSGLTSTLSGATINLTWTDNSNNETRFEIYRQVNGGSFAYYAQVNASITSYSDANLAAGTYAYQVAACNGTAVNTGCSGGSNITPAITIGGSTATTDTLAPSVPANLSAVPYSSSQINLNWNVSTDNVGVSGYKIYRNGSYLIYSTTNSYYDTGLLASTSYSYAVAAYDSAGNLSGQSSSVAAATFAQSSAVTIPATPYNLTAVASGNSVTVSWSGVSGESNYSVYRRNVGSGSGSWIAIATTGSNITTYQDSGLSTGSYEYHVNACNTAGCSPDSPTANVTIGTTSINTASATTTTTLSSDTTPPVFSNIRAENIYGTGAQIKWSTDDFSDSRVFYGTLSKIYPYNANYTCDGGGNVTSHCVNLTNLNYSTTYYYTVVSKNNYGFESSSSEYIFVSGSAISTSSTTVYTSQTTATTSDASIDGTVTDATGKYISAVGVHVFSQNLALNFEATTDSNGNFHFTIPAGTYVAEIFPPLGQSGLIRPAPSTFNVATGEKRSLFLQFGSGVKLVSGLVLFPDGRGVNDAEVGAYSSELGQWQSTFTDSGGRYSLALGGGKWQLGVRPKDPTTAHWNFSGYGPQVEFIKDTTPETRQINLTVQSAAAELTVKAVDQNDATVQDAGIVVDTVSSNQIVSGTRIQPVFQKTDTFGSAVFTLSGGTYYIRGLSKPESGLLNPAEIMISVGSASKQEAKLVFRKPDATISVSLRGVTKFEDGTGTDALVWAWSEKGGFVNARSGANGEFDLKISNADRWHINTGKETAAAYYKSSEITADVFSGDVSVELILVKLDPKSFPPPVSISQSVSQPATEPIIAQAQDGAKINMSATAVAQSGTVNVEIKATVEAPSQAAAHIVSTVYDVTIKDSAGTNIKQLQSDVEITLPYDEKVLKAEGVGEDSIVPSFFDDVAGTWVKIDNYTIDKNKNIIIARVRHLTRFAIIAAADITPPSAPTETGATALGKGKIRLTWKNPTRDFDHAKVYRSEKQDSLGTLIAREVFLEGFVDNKIKNGYLYYYTVRAVDPAGNESNNVNQVNAVAIGTSVANSVPPRQAIKLQILKTLVQGSNGEEVKTLQNILLKEGVYQRGRITGFFGKFTMQAVIRFQEKYAAEILTPLGLTKGTGIVGPATRKKINVLLSAK